MIDVDDITQKQIDYFNNTCSEIVKLSNKVFNLNLKFDPIDEQEPEAYNSWYSAYVRDVAEQMKSKFYGLFKNLESAHIVKPVPSFVTLDEICEIITATLNKLQKY